MNFKIIDLEQGSEAWHEFRRGKIGSSDAAAIMGVSPWETPLQCWERHMFDLKKSQNAAMKRGSDMEEAARKWASERLETPFEPAVIQHSDFPELIASLDGFSENDRVYYLLEIKCPNKTDHEIALSGDVPAHYIPQLQHQMMVADVHAMYYCSFDGQDGVIIPVKRDRKYCDKLFCEEMAFISRLNNFKPPEPVDRDWVEIVDPEKLKRVERLKTIRSIQKDLKLESETLESEIKQDLAHPRTKIGGAKIQKITRPGAIDYSRLEILREIDLEQYRKENVSYWEIRI